MIGLTNHIEAKKQRKIRLDEAKRFKLQRECQRPSELIVRNSDGELELTRKGSEIMEDVLRRFKADEAAKTDDFSTVTTLGEDMQIYNK